MNVAVEHSTTKAHKGLLVPDFGISRQAYMEYGCPSMLWIDTDEVKLYTFFYAENYPVFNLNYGNITRHENRK
jgi:hypothetical protein